MCPYGKAVGLPIESKKRKNQGYSSAIPQFIDTPLSQGRQ